MSRLSLGLDWGDEWSCFYHARPSTSGGEHNRPFILTNVTMSLDWFGWEWSVCRGDWSCVWGPQEPEGQGSACRARSR